MKKQRRLGEFGVRETTEGVRRLGNPYPFFMRVCLGNGYGVLTWNKMEEDNGGLVWASNYKYRMDNLTR